jgi:hypothetical protein
MDEKEAEIKKRITKKCEREYAEKGDEEERTRAVL